MMPPRCDSLFNWKVVKIDGHHMPEVVATLVLESEIETIRDLQESDPAADEQYQHCGAIRNRLQQCVHGFYWRSFHLFSRRRNDFGLATGRRV